MPPEPITECAKLSADDVAPASTVERLSIVVATRGFMTPVRNKHGIMQQKNTMKWDDATVSISMAHTVSMVIARIIILPSGWLIVFRYTRGPAAPMTDASANITPKPASLSPKYDWYTNDATPM